MNPAFLFRANPARVLFGQGTLAKVSDELMNLGITRALVLSTPYQEDQANSLAQSLGASAAGVFAGAVMHTPVDVTERAIKVYEESRADGIVSIGGGSTIGLGKAIALRNDAPQLVIPTTYAGSEMTALLGQTEGGKKTTQSSARVLPETVIYDVDLTLGLPENMTVTSGMNAIAHAVEAMYAEFANPVLSLMAEEGIRALAGALKRLTKDNLDNHAARSDALYGAWLCATCLGNGGVALHHKLCHVLGGSFNLPHAETHTVVLPHALAYNMPAVPDAVSRLKNALASDQPAAALFDIAANAGVPTSLRELGMPEAGIERAIAITLESPYFNPRPIEAEPLRQILTAAWAGERPAC
jgi:alcohol dehydrogenase class IV